MKINELMKTIYTENMSKKGREIYNTEYSNQLEEEYDNLYNKLDKLISDDAASLLDEFCNLQNNMLANSEQIGFEEGFKLGMKLALNAVK